MKEEKTKVHEPYRQYLDPIPSLHLYDGDRDVLAVDLRGCCEEEFSSLLHFLKGEICR